MTGDPRCPSCTEKVSATARWCMHCGVDFDEPVDATVSGGGELTIERERETERETAVAAATRGASSADAGYDDGARTPDAVEAAQHHESPAESPGFVENVTGGESTGSVLAPLFTALDRGEWRRLTVVVGVPLAVALTVRSTTADLAWLVVTASLLLGVSLLRKVRARETVADAALGAGAITLAVIGFDAARTTLASGLGGGVESLAGAWPTLPVALAAVVFGWAVRE